MTPTTTETATGKIFDLQTPCVDDICIHDIAWALSRINRFAGHSMSKIPLSVAQHSIHVSEIAEAVLTPGTEFHNMFTSYIEDKLTAAVENSTNDFGTWVRNRDALKNACTAVNHKEMIVFHALMHDFHEAYLTDIPTPVKKLPGIYENIKKIEDNFDHVIFEKFKLPYNTWPETRAFGNVVVKWADGMALRIEAYHLIKSRGVDWSTTLPLPSLGLLNEYKWPVESIDSYNMLLQRFEAVREKEPQY